MSLVAVGSAYAAVGVAILHYGLLEAVFANDGVRYGAVFAGLAISSGVGVFFNAAVVRCASRQFDGEETSARDGLAAAWDARREIAKRGLVSATIGTLLHVTEDNVPGVGTLTRAILDLGWGLLTFFIVPVIVTDRTGSLRSELRRSGDAFARTWGESVTAAFGIGLALLPVTLTGVCLLAVAYGLGALGGLLVVATLVVTQVLGMIVRTALYRYATDGERVGPLAELDPERIFVDD